MAQQVCFHNYTHYSFAIRFCLKINYEALLKMSYRIQLYAMEIKRDVRKGEGIRNKVIEKEIDKDRREGWGKRQQEKEIREK